MLLTSPGCVPLAEDMQISPHLSLPRTRSERSVAVLTTRGCRLGSAPPAGGYGRRTWQKMSTTTTSRTRTPARLGQTPTVRAAPSPDPEGPDPTQPELFFCSLFFGLFGGGYHANSSESRGLMFGYAEAGAGPLKNTCVDMHPDETLSRC